jgi:hypothetical protein
LKSAAFLFALGLALGCSTSFAQTPASAPAPAEVELKLPNGGTYIGTVTGGVPDGKGYFKDADGMQYEGDVRMGQRTGLAEGVFPKGDRYQGEWKDGKPDGRGTMTYMLGGAYEGEWQNGRRHGTGTMTFAGSGRRAEVRFDRGRRVDVKPELPSRATATARFSLNGDAPTGSNIPNKVAHGTLPLDLGFEQLTPEQQRYVRSIYPALEVGDDPPYPLHGGKELYEMLAKLTGRLRLNNENILVYVSVGADGKVTSVSAIGTLEPEVKRAISVGAALLKYKPGSCAGQPCAGVVPFNMKLTLNN